MLEYDDVTGRRASVLGITKDKERSVATCSVYYGHAPCQTPLVVHMFIHLMERLLARTDIAQNWSYVYTTAICVVLMSLLSSHQVSSLYLVHCVCVPAASPWSLLLSLLLELHVLDARAVMRKQATQVEHRQIAKAGNCQVSLF